MAIKQAYLIDTASVKELGYIQENVRDSILKVVIRRAQDFVIRPILGTKLFERLKTGIINDDLNANETTLLNDYIAPCIAAACDAKAINALTYELRAETAGKAKDEHIEAVSESENSRLFDDIDGDVLGYREILIGYLKDNSDLFPEYEDPDCSHENMKPDSGKPRTRVRFT